MKKRNIGTANLGSEAEPPPPKPKTHSDIEILEMPRWLTRTERKIPKVKIISSQYWTISMWWNIATGHIFNTSSRPSEFVQYIKYYNHLVHLSTTYWVVVINKLPPQIIWFLLFTPKRYKTCKHRPVRVIAARETGNLGSVKGTIVTTYSIVFEHLTPK